MLFGIASFCQSLSLYRLQLSDAVDERGFHRASAHCDLGTDLRDVFRVPGSIGIEPKPALDGAAPCYEFAGEYGTEPRDGFNNVRFDIPRGFYTEGTERHFSSVSDAIDPRAVYFMSL